MKPSLLLVVLGATAIAAADQFLPPAIARADTPITPPPSITLSDKDIDDKEDIAVRSDEKIDLGLSIDEEFDDKGSAYATTLHNHVDIGVTRDDEKDIRVKSEKIAKGCNGCVYDGLSRVYWEAGNWRDMAKTHVCVRSISNKERAKRIRDELENWSGRSWVVAVTNDDLGFSARAENPNDRAFWRSVCSKTMFIWNTKYHSSCTRIKSQADRIVENAVNRERTSVRIKKRIESDLKNNGIKKHLVIVQEKEYDYAQLAASYAQITANSCSVRYEGSRHKAYVYLDGRVSCGNHYASDCSLCPQGPGKWHGKRWCNGDCYWSNYECIQKY